MSFICSFRNKNEHTDECDILTPVIPQVEEQREHTFAAPQQGDALELGEAVDVTDHERSTARSIPLPQKKKSSRVLHLLTVNLCILHGSCQPPPECGQPKAFCRFLSLSLPLSLPPCLSLLSTIASQRALRAHGRMPQDFLYRAASTSDASPRWQ